MINTNIKKSQEVLTVAKLKYLKSVVHSRTFKKSQNKSDFLYCQSFFNILEILISIATLKKRKQLIGIDALERMPFDAILGFGVLNLPTTDLKSASETITMKRVFEMIKISNKSDKKFKEPLTSFDASKTLVEQLFPNVNISRAHNLLDIEKLLKRELGSKRNTWYELLLDKGVEDITEVLDEAQNTKYYSQSYIAFYQLSSQSLHNLTFTDDSKKDLLPEGLRTVIEAGLFGFAFSDFVIHFSLSKDDQIQLIGTELRAAYQAGLNYVKEQEWMNSISDRT